MGDNYFPREKVRALMVVFIGLVPRSSRVSRDWAKMLDRLFGFGGGWVAVELSRN